MFLILPIWCNCPSVPTVAALSGCCFSFHMLACEGMWVQTWSLTGRTTEDIWAKCCKTAQFFLSPSVSGHMNDNTAAGWCHSVFLEMWPIIASSSLDLQRAFIPKLQILPKHQKNKMTIYLSRTFNSWYWNNMDAQAINNGLMFLVLFKKKIF